ncbi:MAG TPA: hypothetical protein VLT87_20430 [Thermoanaerobaculia bacterium]|nr:hypothetical protein [Thermoanaerobaculia bacterium]
MTSKFEFTILGNPIGIERSDRTQLNQAYYVIQAWGVADSTNQIHINGHALQGLDIPPNAYEGWQAWTGFFTKPLLKQGINHVYIKRDLSSESSFLIGSMLIGWGEFPLVPDREGQRPGEGKIPRISGRRESPPESA